MKYVVIILFVLFSFSQVLAQQPVNKRTELQMKSGLAINYYNSKDYEKALPLLLEVYTISRNPAYYRYYLNALIELGRLEEAEQEVQKEISRQRLPRPEMYINWGHVLKVQQRTDEAKEKFEKAIELTPANKGSYLVVASNFITWGEYGFARDTYLKGREVLAPEQFNYELARAYLYLRNYDKMMEEYLNLLRTDERQISRVQSVLASAMRMDIDDELRDKFRKQVLKRIQAEPNVTGYNRLLVWFFLQEKKFASALRQSIALDRRTANEDAQIMQLGNMALSNKSYSDAKKAFAYLLNKGNKTPYYRQAYIQKINASYLHFTTQNPDNMQEGATLESEFEEGLKVVGKNAATIHLIRDYAHLLAFYLNKTDKAISVLEDGLKIPRLKPIETGTLKTELADIYIYSNDPWEAMLIYSQVIDANKKNSLGDEVKLKKAKLGYFIGNFSWAKAQLDVLKASTSKLTANDALDLSLLIGNNLNLDTTAVPLQMFARADLLFFRNKNKEAMATLDSLIELYPYHTLVDDIYFRKAKIEIENGNHLKAAEYLKKIISDFSFDLLGDDATFLLAEISNYNLNQKEKAKDLYKQILTDFPGSIFTEEARLKYRELLEIYPDKDEQQKANEDLFMEGTKPNEFE